MSVAGTVRTATEWATPVGKLILAEDGSVRAIVRGSQSGQPRISAVQAVAALKDRPFLRSSGFQQDPDGLALSWPATRFAAPLPVLVKEWRQIPAVHLSTALDLAQNIGKAASALDYLRPQRFLLSAAQTFLCRDESDIEFWGITALPLEGAQYADFASASPQLLAWLSADEILESAAIDRAYLTGAVLYYCLIGELFPEDISKAERLLRHLSYRGGNAARAKAALSAALPKSLAGLGPRMADFIAGLLTPSYGRLITPARAALELELLAGELAPPRLAAAWEAEGNLHFAVAILNSFAKRVSSHQVPWEIVARLRAQTGDPEGAKQAAEKVPPDLGQQPGSYFSHLRRAAARGPEGRAELEQAVARLKSASQSNPPMPDEEFLYLVYINGRWLGHLEESLQFLARNFPVSWHSIVRVILVARFSAERGAWGTVLRSCRDCRSMIDKLPNRGSGAGRYATGYVDLLDGIAHVRAVEAGMSEAYLEDALIKLENAWIVVQEFAPDDLAPIIMSWLAAVTCRIAGKPGLELLKLSAEAFCHSIGIDPAHSDQQAAPAVPWFSEERVFGS